MALRLYLNNEKDYIRISDLLVVKWGPKRGKRDGMIGHISTREFVNWMKNLLIT